MSLRGISSAEVDLIQGQLEFLRRERIWPNGLRYLWTDAFGLVLLVSLHRATGQAAYLEQARELVSEVERVLGRRRGLRIGEAADRDGQYYHYLAMWIFALDRLGEVDPQYHERAVHLARIVHESFVMPGIGVVWKMVEDLSRPYPGYGLGALDPFHGFVVYRTLAEPTLRREVDELHELVQRSYRRLEITQDLGLGMMLWMTHFFPDEEWAVVQRDRSLALLDRLWVDPPGYFCREPGHQHVVFSFTNSGIALGLQAVHAWPGRVARLRTHFADFRSHDHYDTDAITHVMRLVAGFPGEFLRAGVQRAMQA